MTPPTSSGFGTTMRTSRKSYSRKTLTHVSPGSMISSSTSDSDNSLHSLYFTSYHGLINYPQKIPAREVLADWQPGESHSHGGTFLMQGVPFVFPPPPRTIMPSLQSSYVSQNERQTVLCPILQLCGGQQAHSAL